MNTSSAEAWQLLISESGAAFAAVKIAETVERLEKLVYVPGQWRCPKCNFRLTQSNLYAASGTVGSRDELGDKCPNCNGPLWRVSAMDDRNEAFKCANETFDRLHAAEQRVKELERERNELVDQLSYADLRASGGLPEGLNAEAKNYPEFDNPRDPYASKDRLPPDNSLTKPDDMGIPERETKGLAKHFQEASGAGLKRARRKKLSKLVGSRCPDCGDPRDPHLCNGPSKRSTRMYVFPNNRKGI